MNILYSLRAIEIRPEQNPLMYGTCSRFPALNRMLLKLEEIPGSWENTIDRLPVITVGETEFLQKIRKFLLFDPAVLLMAMKMKSDS